MAIADMSTMSWVLVAVAAFIAIMVSARVKKGKKVVGFKRNTIVGLFLIVGVALFAIQAGFLTGIVEPFALGAAPEAPPRDGVPAEVFDELCPPGSVEDVTVTLSATDYDTGKASGGTHRYRVNGNPALTVSDAGTFTAAAGDTIEVLWYNASISGTYFSDVSTYQLGCSKGAQTLTRALHDNGTADVAVFNEEGNLIDGYNDFAVGACVENESLANGDVVTLKAEYKQAYQTSAPYGAVMIVEYNVSCLDDVIVDFGGVEVNVPQSIMKNYSLSTAAAFKAYSIPATYSSDILYGSITIDVDDTQDPQVEAAGVGSLHLYTLVNNYYIDDDAGGAFAGPAANDDDDFWTMRYFDNYSLCID